MSDTTLVRQIWIMYPRRYHTRISGKRKHPIQNYGSCLHNHSFQKIICTIKENPFCNLETSMENTKRKEKILTLVIKCIIINGYSETK
uniref:Uncharacterized protein n=1 Tax=Rhizophora mucronata TaxID=61149 RepID=A0A2P2N5H2_RHIMU